MARTIWRILDATRLNDKCVGAFLDMCTRCGLPLSLTCCRRASNITFSGRDEFSRCHDVTETTPCPAFSWRLQSALGRRTFMDHGGQYPMSSLRWTEARKIIRVCWMAWTVRTNTSTSGHIVHCPLVRVLVPTESTTQKMATMFHKLWFWNVRPT